MNESKQLKIIYLFTWRERVIPRDTDWCTSNSQVFSAWKSSRFTVRQWRTADCDRPFVRWYSHSCLRTSILARVDPWGYRSPRCTLDSCRAAQCDPCSHWSYWFHSQALHSPRQAIARRTSRSLTRTPEPCAALANPTRKSRTKWSYCPSSWRWSRACRRDSRTESSQWSSDATSVSWIRNTRINSTSLPSYPSHSHQDGCARNTDTDPKPPTDLLASTPHCDGTLRWYS